MASIQVRKETGCLILDFYYQGKRCREQTALPDTAGNRKKVKKFLDKIEEAMSLGTFSYEQYFPNSKQPEKMAETPMATAVAAVAAAVAGVPYPPADTALDATPLFKDFVEIWFAEKSIEWRKSHRATIHMDIDKVLVPRFGDKVVGRITKAEILSFRAELAKVQARGKKSSLSNQRINKLLAPLRMVLSEAADRFDFRMPFQNIKQLRIRKTDCHPFSLDEVKRILDTVRPDYRNYFTVRFFTGMRTGEVDGLQWKYVDFARRLILVRETVVNGDEEYTKTDGSQRDIHMSQVVFDALKTQETDTRHLSKFVFCNRAGSSLTHKNVTNRVWYPLLRHLGIVPRRPYQCRHTCATLWLASGESPQWIAMQLGHTTTEMLFRVYSRFVPNLTRQDGSAFERLLMQSGTVAMSPASAPPASAVPPVSATPTPAPATPEPVKEFSHE
jgi:integrase